MRLISLAVALAGVASGVMSQTITEFGAAAAGGTAGGAAGKKVSDGITSIFGKVDQSTAAAAATAAPKSAAPAKPAAPLLEVSPGVVGTALPPSAPAPKAAPKTPVSRASVIDGVPPPPPLPGERSKRVEPPKRLEPVTLVAVAAPPPPPPPVTPDDLRSLTLGQSREDVIKLGAPASRITMFEDGHLLEIFRYMSGDLTFGVVRVSDGAVAEVLVR
jgi:hypothetical protein